MQEVKVYGSCSSKKGLSREGSSHTHCLLVGRPLLTLGTLVYYKCPSWGPGIQYHMVTCQGISHSLWESLSINGKLEGLSSKPSEVAVEVGAQPCPLVSAPGLNQVEGAASVTPEQLLEGLGTKTAAATNISSSHWVNTRRTWVLAKAMQWGPRNRSRRHTGDAAGAGWLLHSIPCALGSDLAQ